MSIQKLIEFIFSIVSLLSDVMTIIASGIAIFVFFAKRKQLSSALNTLLNYSYQTTLGELKEKLERLNEYNASVPSELQEIRNILHEISGQIRGNPRLAKTANNIVKKIERLADSSSLSEPKKRSIISELREFLRSLHIDSIEPSPGK